MSIESEDKALQILNALAPLSRRDEWWATNGPVAVIERELRRLYPIAPLNQQEVFQQFQNTETMQRYEGKQ
jgi:hypothetical protein